MATDPKPTAEQAQVIEMLMPILGSVTNEVREFSKKKQDGVLSELKVTQINRLLVDVKEALGDDPSTRYLDLLDEEMLPQNSDAVLVLSQWMAALKQFRDKHLGWSSGDRVWRLKGGKTLRIER
jgi:hypothetical protein